MWKIEKDFRFEASHRLPAHGGKCARLHGHSWRGTVVCEAKSLSESGETIGMVMDFAEISKVLDPLLEERLDHHHLNETLDLEHPTCEAVAKWIFDFLKPSLPMMKMIRIEETCTGRCSYENP